MKRLVLAATLTLIPVLVGCDGLMGFIAERQAISKAEFAFERIELQSLDIPYLTPNAQAHMRVVLKVSNPNPITARLDRLDYTFFLEGAQVGEGAMTDDFAVDAGATRELVLPLSIPYQGLPDPALKAIQARRAAMTLKGHSQIDTPLGRLSYPAEASKTLEFQGL
jgi:LEA14-like dessication related protein